MPIKNALVVDDSMSARVMLRRMLEQKKVSVDLAETAEEALTYLQSKKPDVVFMDHILPGMNGFDATKEITTNPKTAMIPVIMYTSKEGNEYLEQARAHGALGILRKPAKPAALAAITLVSTRQNRFMHTSWCGFPFVSKWKRKTQAG